MIQKDNKIAHKKSEIIKKLFLVDKKKDSSRQNENLSNSINKLKYFVNSFIKQDDDGLKKKVEEYINAVDDPLGGMEVDGFVINVETTGEKLPDYSKPFYTSSGEPETILEKQDYTKFNLMTNNDGLKKVSTDTINEEFEEADAQITKKILQGEGLDELLEDKNISDILLGGKNPAKSNKKK